ncbi:L-2,4-diaminobutyrate decarboxylase [Allorhodopirellula heiligendammensis]|uniref:L-2,4-diaminobutyrate decarboxylase n=2 Tax=Allorhodopirellula heiligendammensis TaxID=2714739 RepID=A0A5C6BYW8_9BACT|nr:L-2,4-diaminobutyrate decarboxylase [Allorhodopirellula heiligendammensis]
MLFASSWPRSYRSLTDEPTPVSISCSLGNMTRPRTNPLELSGEQMRLATQRVLDLLIEMTEGNHRCPASGGDLSAGCLKDVSRPPAEGPRELDDLLKIVRAAVDPSYQSAGPGYMAYIPSGGIFTSALAEFLACGLNRYTGKVKTAPALVALEESVLRWICDLFGFPAESQALLTSGGSMANLIALTTARTVHADGQVDRATLYIGDQGHGSLAKAARTAGISRDHIRVIRSDSALQLDTEHLKDCLTADRDAGLIPVCICATAGTTNSGTIDPLREIAGIARQFQVWFHVDGAYGGLFQLTERGRRRLTGIERADSITIDPHKTLFLPFGTGAVVVRSRELLRRTFSEPADYMHDIYGASDLDITAGLPDFDELSPELTRPFRGLRLWLPLHLHGVNAFAEQINEKLDLATIAFERLATDECFEVPWSPDLSVVVFRLRGRDDDVQLDFLNRINLTQRVLLSSTRIGGSIFLRLAILSVRTHFDRVNEALEIISQAARAYRSQ